MRVVFVPRSVEILPLSYELSVLGMRNNRLVSESHWSRSVKPVRFSQTQIEWCERNAKGSNHASLLNPVSFSCRDITDSNGRSDTCLFYCLVHSFGGIGQDRWNELLEQM